MTTSDNILLFRLNVYHDYFGSGLCPCLHFAAGDDTVALQKRYGFLINHHSYGFEWYADSKRAMPDFLAYITTVCGADSFNFNITTPYEGFYGFTQLPVGWAGQFSFDSNKSTPTENGAELQPQLSASTVNGPLGKLKISFSDIISGRGNTYTIRFAARATQWQYFVVNNSQVPLNQPLVKGINGDSFRFAGPENVSLANGQQALLFTSGTRLIPLSETPENKFSLLSTPEHTGNGVSAKPVFKNLPQPDPLYWEFTEVNGTQQTSSPMYVYL